MKQILTLKIVSCLQGLILKLIIAKRSRLLKYEAYLIRFPLKAHFVCITRSCLVTVFL